MMQDLYCLGDSHAVVFAAKDPKREPANVWLHNGTYHANRLGPILAYNLPEKREQVARVMAEVPTGANLMFCLGEIDCRAHLKRQAEKQGRPIESIIQECVERYVLVPSEYAQKGFRVFIWNVPPPLEHIDNAEYPSYGSYGERRYITEKFNTTLETLCAVHGLIFISVYDSFVTPASTKKECFRDEVHLSEETVLPIVQDRIKYLLQDSPEYFAQIGQDRILDEEFFKNKYNGVFVEVGACDGTHFSNTLFFERSRDWRGICVEPNPIEFAKLKTCNRRAYLEHCAISNVEGEADFLAIDGYGRGLSGLVGSYDPRHIKRIETELAGRDSRTYMVRVPVVPLQKIFDKHNLRHVDFCSIDVEGAEYDVLSSVDFDKTNIRCILLENNYGLERERALLESKGYRLWRKIQFDDVYVREERILVYCGLNKGESFGEIYRNFDRCFAFEANPHFFENGQYNRFKGKNNVSLIHGALTTYDGAVNFNICSFDPASSLGSFSAEYLQEKPYAKGYLTSETVNVPAINLINFLARNKIDNIDTYISDLQGMDLEILRTIKPYIDQKRIRSIQCEVAKNRNVYDLPANNLAAFEELLGENYRKVAAGEGLLGAETDAVPETYWTYDVKWVLKKTDEATLSATGTHKQQGNMHMGNVAPAGINTVQVSPAVPSPPVNMKFWQDAIANNSRELIDSLLQNR